MPPTIDDSVVVYIQPNPARHTLVSNDAALFTFNSALRTIVFGSFAGMVSEVFEYPFDLAKVRLQAQLLSPITDMKRLRFNGPLDCLRQTWREEGLRGLYRGLPAPIIGSMAETAALFVAYSGFQDAIRSVTFRTRADKLSIPELGLAAAAAGFVSSFIITPIELVKCRMQVQMMNMPRQRAHNTLHHSLSASALLARSLAFPVLPRDATTISKSSSLSRRTLHDHHLSTHVRLPPGPIGVLREIIQTHGFRGLWIGQTGTLVRETGGTASWFAVKELVANVLLQRRKVRENSQSLVLERSSATPSTNNMDIGTELLSWESALSGAIAGGVCVLAFYPADTVKSAMQTEDELRPSGSRSSTPVKQATCIQNSLRQTFTRTLVQMYAAHGLRGLYAGCGMTVARAVPSSGIVFVVYDGLASWLG